MPGKPFAYSLPRKRKEVLFMLKLVLVIIVPVAIFSVIHLEALRERKEFKKLLGSEFEQIKSIK